LSLQLARWNALPEEDAAAQMQRLCGSRAWARCLARGRPIGGEDRLLETAEDCWRGLSETDWLEAFAGHPRIGDRNAAGEAAREQSGVRDASDETLEALARSNREYEERFGRIFLICATGLSASEMLAVCRQRLQNDPATELAVSVEEQKRITRLRLEKWLTP
jgi:OHCU decarboxylase